MWTTNSTALKYILTVLTFFSLCLKIKKKRVKIINLSQISHKLLIMNHKIQYEIIMIVLKMYIISI